jgi:hypothetical protein
MEIKKQLYFKYTVVTSTIEKEIKTFISDANTTTDKLGFNKVLKKEMIETDETDIKEIWKLFENLKEN